MAGKVAYRRHYRRGKEDVTVSSDEKLSPAGWDKLVRERHGEGWVEVAPHIAMNPFPRMNRKGMLP